MRYGESVVDHVFSTTVLGWTIAQELKLDVDVNKVLKLLLFHEIGEIYTGDLVSVKDRDVTREQQLKKRGFSKDF